MGLLSSLVRGRENGFRVRVRRGITDRLRSWDRQVRPPARGQHPPAPCHRGVEDEPGVPGPDTRADEPAAGFHRVAVVGDVPPGRMKEVFVAGRSVTLANVAGAWHAFASDCPHAGGPLSEGALDGAMLTCPYHGWTFDVRDGTCHVNPEKRLELFVVQEMEGVIYLGPRWASG